MLENEFATVIPSEVIAGVQFVHPKTIEDDRGRFAEIFRGEWVPGAREMVQVNRSFSKAGVLRGMHYHLFQADYWFVTEGHAFVALFDFRATSKTAEKTQTFEIKASEPTGVYIPPGVAHGFFSVEDTTLLYMVDQTFDGTDELGVYFDDPALDITWPFTEEPTLSERDKACPMLAEVQEENLPL